MKIAFYLCGKIVFTADVIRPPLTSLNMKHAGEFPN